MTALAAVSWALSVLAGIVLAWGTAKALGWLADGIARMLAWVVDGWVRYRRERKGPMATRREVVSGRQ